MAEGLLTSEVEIEGNVKPGLEATQRKRERTTQCNMGSWTGVLEWRGALLG